MGIPLDYQVLFACNSESLLTVDGIINKISMIFKLSETEINANNQKYVEAIHKLFEKGYLDFGINEGGCNA